MPVVTNHAYGALTCPHCGAALPPHALAADKEELCPGCRIPLRGQVFRVWSTPRPEPPTTSDRALEGEAVCFFHPSNRAALPCDACGRFICTICDLQIGSRHLCPVCLGSGLGKQKLPEIISKRFLWSFVAFWLGLVPLVGVIFLWPVLIVTGPMAIILALVGWNRPGSLVRGRQRWAAVVGILFGLAQLGVTFGFISLFAAMRSR
jgi:hypothetical protein